MPKAMNLREMRRQYEAVGAAQTVAFWAECFENGDIKPDECSIRDLAEAYLGPDIVRAMGRQRSGGMTLQEASNAVDASTFSAITGQLLFTKVRDEYRVATLIADQLITTMPTNFLEGEKIPGIAGIGDEAEIIEEGYPYPLAGLGPEYIQAPPTKKRGFIVPVTREAIIADRTGVLLRRAGDGGKWMGINKEKRVIDVVVGVINNYSRNGTSTNTYLTAGAYVNQQANTFVDWNSIATSELLFDAMLDPNTGEPIGISPGGYTLLVPTALRMAALRVANATEVRYGDGASNTSAYYMGNPLNDRPSGSGGVAVVSSPYVKARTGSASTWFYGQPKESFSYSEVWGVETTQAPAQSEKEFNNDIAQQYKVSERGVAWANEPRRMTKNT